MRLLKKRGRRFFCICLLGISLLGMGTKTQGAEGEGVEVEGAEIETSGKENVGTSNSEIESTLIDPDKNEEFYLSLPRGEVATFSFDNSSRLPVSNVRYDKFLWPSGGTGTASCPNMGIGMKYIVGDDTNPDGGGKWRYVYCLEFAKDCPIGGLQMDFTNAWTNRKVAYALYYGALYYGYPCRYTPYSTGDWKMDYFVTQIAVHILNGEYTLAAAKNGMNKSSATTAEKNLAYDRISKIVNDANTSSNFGGFTSNGWIDLNQASFSLKGYTDSWSLQNGNYVSGGNFQAVFTSYYGYDFREQLTGYDIQVPQGVTGQKKGNQTYADFQVAIKEEQYKKWQLTGMQIPITVSASIPRYWGGGMYASSSASNFQKVCFLTWDGSGGTAKYQTQVKLNIPKITKNLTIYKKDQETGKALSGATFSLWAYDGSAYSKKVGTFVDQGDGSYLMKEISYTQTQDGWFLIKEEKAPENYKETYVCENSKDEENYQQYGGREIRMNENGFYSDRVENPLIFYDEKEEPKAEVVIRKQDIKTKAALEGAEFQIFAWDKEREDYVEDAIQTLRYDGQKNVYRTIKMLVADSKNQGKFLIKETKTPENYCGKWEKEIVLAKPGTETIELTVDNYPNRTFTVQKKIRTDEIVWAHGNPTFFFKITGKDIEGEEHWYLGMITFTKKDMEKEEKGYLTGETTIEHIPAGIYEVEELPLTSRYILHDAESKDENVTVEKIPMDPVNGVNQISTRIIADLQLNDGSVIFENRKVYFDEYSHDDVEVNHLKKGTK